MNQTAILLTVFLTSGMSAYAAPSDAPGSYPPPPERFSIHREAPSRIHPAVEIQSGVAQYPILAMPYSQNSNMRVDSTTDREDVTFNQGVILGLALSRHDKTFKVPYTLGLGAMRVASPPGGGTATPSSYARIYLYGDMDIATGFSPLTIIPGVESRRSMYSNVDSGHYVDALLARLAARYAATDSLQLTATAAYAPVATLGIRQTSGSSGALKGSTARVTETGATLAWITSPETSFTLGAFQENTIVILRDYQGYRTYGLPAVPSGASDNDTVYNLTVRQVKIGATRHF